MIPFFPTPQPDEAYFSLFTRYHLLSGNSSYLESARILFSGHHRVAFDAIPRSLPSFARQIRELHDITPHDLVEKFTLLPFLRLFCSPERYRRITSVALPVPWTQDKSHAAIWS
ncbi:TniQ family protein [Geobacter anodireducens]